MDAATKRKHQENKGREELVLEVFRNDSELKFVYSQFTPDLPLELIAYAISISRQKLGHFVL